MGDVPLAMPPELTGWYTIPAVNMDGLSPKAYTAYMHLGMCIPGGDPDRAYTNPMDMVDLVGTTKLNKEDIREALIELTERYYIIVHRAVDFAFDEIYDEFQLGKLDPEKSQVVIEFLFEGYGSERQQKDTL